MPISPNTPNFLNISLNLAPSKLESSPLSNSFSKPSTFSSKALTLADPAENPTTKTNIERGKTTMNENRTLETARVERNPRQNETASLESSKTRDRGKVEVTAPIGVPIYLAISSSRRSRDVEEPLIVYEEVEKLGKEEAKVIAVEKRVNLVPGIGEDHTIREALLKLDFWILFVSFLCGVGTGLAVMNYIGQMGFAMGCANVSLFASMTSIWGFFGRTGSGSLSEYFLRLIVALNVLWKILYQH